MRAKLVTKEGALIGFVDCAHDDRVIVILDTRGYANDVYIRKGNDSQFELTRSLWLGKDDIDPSASKRPIRAATKAERDWIAGKRK